MMKMMNGSAIEMPSGMVILLSMVVAMMMANKIFMINHAEILHSTLSLAAAHLSAFCFLPYIRVRLKDREL